MITLIIMEMMSARQHIRRYDTDDPKVARERFVEEWITRGIEWDDPQMDGPNCTVDNPAFTVEFLRQYEDEDQPELIEEGVSVQYWWCKRGPRFDDEIGVVGYFVPSR